VAVIAAVDLFPPDMPVDTADPGVSGAAPGLWQIAEGRAGLALGAPERSTDGTRRLARSSFRAAGARRIQRALHVRVRLM